MLNTACVRACVRANSGPRFTGNVLKVNDRSYDVMLIILVHVVPDYYFMN